MSAIKKHSDILLPLAITIIVLIIAALNFKPGTFLSGWDTLHPEFNFGMNFRNLIQGVWREEQGLGAMSGHTHMADIPRVVFLWTAHLLFPLYSLKYLYIFACLLIGPLGMYYLIKNIVSTNMDRSRPVPTVRLIAFLSALFYLLNLSTVQQFFVPFEMFPTQYAFLPWIILYSIKYLVSSGKWRKNLIWFCIVTLLASPQAYAAHLWYPFFGVYCISIFLYTALQTEKKKYLKKSVVLILLTLALNAFWLLPNFYFIATSSNIPKEAKQNRIFSQEYRLRNRENGYLQDVALVKGFYTNWTIYDFQKGTFVSLMKNWNDYFKNPIIPSIGYLFFGLSIAGIVLAIKEKNKLYISFLPFFVLPFIFLMNHTAPFEWIFDLLLKISVTEEALRFVFTKFSVLIIFSYAVFFSYCVQWLFRFLTKQNVLLFSVATAFLLFVYTLPLFQHGGLISEKVQITIPQEYFDFWKFMNTQPQGKVLALPLYNFSGWQYYNFGYQGSGFIWFGLKQPILDRDSDRWSTANEQAYKELQYALYSKDTDTFIENLKKFKITYILWDKNVISPGEKNANQIIYEREISTILTTLLYQRKITLTGQFNNLTIYSLSQPSQPISLIKKAPNILPSYQWSAADPAYEHLGSYITTPKAQQNNFYYPFRSILDKTERVRKDLLVIEPDSNSYSLHTEPSITNGNLFVPDYLNSEETLFAKTTIQRLNGNQYQLEFSFIVPKGIFKPVTYTLSLPSPTGSFSINNKNFSVKTQLIQTDEPLYIGESILNTKQPNYINGNKINLQFEQQIKTYSELTQLFSKFPLQQQKYTAKELYKNETFNPNISLNSDSENITLKTTNQQSGVFLQLNSLPHSYGYIIAFEARNIKGLPLRICMKNLYAKICSLYDELSRSDNWTTDYFLLPPTGEDIGYTLSIDNISYGNYESINDLKNVTVIPFPYNFLSKVYYSDSQKSSIKSQIDTISFSDTRFKWNALIPAQNKESVIALYQSYHPGWIAFQNGSLLQHVLVNNWANGWILREDSSKSSVFIIFWPQYLEYFGLILILISFIALYRVDFTSSIWYSIYKLYEKFRNRKQIV